MANANRFFVSGAGIVSIELPPYARQIVGILAKPDNSASPVALDAAVFCCPTEPSGSIPAGSAHLGTFTSVAGGPSQFMGLSPDGIDVSGWLAVQFFDAGTQHSVYVYVK